MAEGGRIFTHRSWITLVIIVKGSRAQFHNKKNCLSDLNTLFFFQLHVLHTVQEYIVRLVIVRNIRCLHVIHCDPPVCSVQFLEGSEFIYYPCHKKQRNAHTYHSICSFKKLLT